MKKVSMTAAFIVLVVIGQAQALELSPGEIFDLNCTEHCVDGMVNLTCTVCPPCNETGKCTIDRMLHWNETYVNNEGNCDLEISCEEMNTSKLGFVSFPIKGTIEKDINNSVTFHAQIFDYNGNVIDNWGPRKYLRESVVSEKFEYEFSCPAELSTDVNMLTCAPYLMRVLNSSDPMMLQMVTGQTICTQELVDCMSTVESEMKEANKWEIKHTACNEERNSFEVDLDKCLFNMNDPDGKRYRDVIRVRDEYAGYANLWMLACILMIVLGALWFAYMHYSNEKFESGEGVM